MDRGSAAYPQDIGEPSIGFDDGGPASPGEADPSGGDRSAGTLRAPATTRPRIPPSGLATALGSRPAAPGPASLVGLEHEYALTSGGERLDFRQVIRGLDLPGRRLDPGDANAYRCRSGLVITCDDEEAEVVSPPVPVRPGFTADIADWAVRGADELRRVLPAGVAARGFSTHLSASMPPRLVGPLCALFAETFAPALMLVLDRADSHGLFLRPRPGRVELCGEFATGPGWARPPPSSPVGPGRAPRPW